MKKTLIAAALAAAFTLPAAAHEWPADGDGKQPGFSFEFEWGDLLAQADVPRAQVHGVDMVDWAKDFSAEMSHSMAYMFTDRAGRGRVVKGQPYSADIVTETNQTLPDGNVITHRNVNKVWRDGEGRTRQETWRKEKLRSIYISDPVGSVAYTLLPDSKLAITIPRMDFNLHAAPRARVERHERHEGERDRPGKSSSSEVSSDGRRVIVRTVNSDGPGVREEVRVQVVRVGDDSSVVIAPRPPVPPVPPVPAVPGVAPVPPAPPVPPVPGINMMRFESTAHLGKGDVKSLGTRDFEGVKAEGKQTTWTIPAGKIGNQRPINVISESWYSPELQVTVYSRHNDPRTGESVYRLAAVKRGEPSADLFKVPEGYSVKGRNAPRARDKDKEKSKDK